MRFKNPIFLPFILILLSITASCSPSNIDATGSTGSTGIIGGTPTPSTIVVSFSDVVTGVTVTSIPSSGAVNVNATVRDSFNSLVSGVTVTFTVTVTNPVAGAFTATTATTNAGIATVRFDANAVNVQVIITASVLGNGVTISNTASLKIGTPLPPNPTNLTLTVNPLTINIQGTAQITATASSSGSPVFDTPIQLDIISGGTTTLDSFSASVLVTSITVTTDASGVATATFYAGTSSGSDTIRASVAATPVPLVASQSINITSSPNSVSVTITPSSIYTGQTANIVARVLNVLGNPVPDGTQVTFSCTAGNCGIGNFPTPATTLSGNASVTFTASSTVTGNAQIQAVAGTAAPGSANITVNPLNAGSIDFVSAQPQLIGIAGSGVQNTSVVTFLVKNQAGSTLSGNTVYFTLFGPTGATLLNTTGSSGTDGKVSTTLSAGAVPGPARIVAELVSGGTTTIYSSSGNISIGGNVPDSKHFDLSTSRFNLDGIGCNGVTANITAYMADRYGNKNVLQGTSVSFAIEAGAIDAAGTTDATGIAKVSLRTQAPSPLDVDPLLGEPSYTSTDIITGQTYTRNPRDGWVSIIAMTTGEETFVDENANGLYDPGEDIDDLGEPFIDSNDSNTYNVGEQFFNWPALVSGNTSTRDSGNSQWDSQIPLWHPFTIAFTGPPHVSDFTSRIENDLLPPNQFDDVIISKGTSSTFYVYISDRNINALIAGTTVTVTSSDAKGAVTVLSGSLSLLDELPFGPAILVISLKNNNTVLTDPAVTTTLTAEVNWPGACGAVKVKFPFKGTITLQ